MVTVLGSALLKLFVRRTAYLRGVRSGMLQGWAVRAGRVPHGPLGFLLSDFRDSDPLLLLGGCGRLCPHMK